MEAFYAVVVVVSLCLFNQVYAGIVPGTRTVGQTATVKDTSPLNLNDFLRSITSSDPTINSKVTKALDEFVSSVIPAHCQHFQDMQNDFFKNFAITSNIEVDKQFTKAFESLMKSMMPAVCDENSTKNIVSKGATSTLFDQLSKFGDWIRSGADKGPLDSN